MQLNLNSLEGKLLIILLFCIAAYCIYKAVTKEKKEEKPLKKLERQGNREVWTKDTQKKWTTTGWYYDEQKGEWVSPDYANSRKNTKIHNIEVFAQAEQDKHIRLSKDGPTFEEWKAARMKEQQDKLK